MAIGAEEDQKEDARTTWALFRLFGRCIPRIGKSGGRTGRPVPGSRIYYMLHKKVKVSKSKSK